jgi:hypothetical protein
MLHDLIVGIGFSKRQYNTVDGDQRHDVSHDQRHQFDMHLGADYMEHFQPRGNPGLNSALLTGLKFFAITDDFNPGVETLYYTFSASIRGSKKSLYFVFL